jgi:hypothetical protein
MSEATMSVLSHSVVPCVQEEVNKRIETAYKGWVDMNDNQDCCSCVVTADS